MKTIQYLGYTIETAEIPYEDVTVYCAECKDFTFLTSYNEIESHAVSLLKEAIIETLEGHYEDWK